MTARLPAADAARRGCARLAAGIGTLIARKADAAALSAVLTPRPSAVVMEQGSYGVTRLEPCHLGAVAYQPSALSVVKSHPSHDQL